MTSTSGLRPEEALPLPAPIRRAPAWSLLLIGALGAPWIYFGGQRAVSYVDARLPGHGVEHQSFPTSTRQNWIGRGFVQMVPPLRPPSRLDGSEAIEVWIHFPDRGEIGVRWLADQRRFALVYPPGTTADRVEFLDGVHAVDVRGTDLGDSGAEAFHVFRGDGAGLDGYSWRRDDRQAQDTATRILVATSRLGPKETETMRVNNACAACHEHARPERRAAVPARATDSAGWFVPETVLSDRAPVERHRPREMNVDDRFVRFACPRDDGESIAATIITHRDGTRWPSCPDGAAAIGILDVASAVAAGDAHALALCGSRAAIHPHLDAEARRVFAKALDDCGIR